jgi:hypothetical protein
LKKINFPDIYNKSGKLMKPYIYLIFDKIKNKPYYIGKHSGNNKNYITGSKILRRYIKIFGIDSYLIRFDKQILEYCSLDVLDKLEENYIKKYKTKLHGGNLTWGGKWDIKYRVPKHKPVLQYDLKGNFIKEWDYVKQPIEQGTGTDYNGISACCLGKQKSANGYIWRFKENNIPLTIPPKPKQNYPKNRKSRKI